MQVNTYNPNLVSGKPSIASHNEANHITTVLTTVAVTESLQVFPLPASLSILPERPFKVMQADFIPPEVPTVATSQSIVSLQHSLREMPAKSVSVLSNIMQQETSSCLEVDILQTPKVQGDGSL